MNTRVESIDRARAGGGRQAVYRVLETANNKDLASRTVDIALIALIALSVIAVILESVPSIEIRFDSQLYWFEVFTVGVFSVEYVLRLWCAVENPAYAGMSAARARLRYAFSFHAIIDLLAILPFYLLTFGLVTSVDMRFLRAFRLLRVLKLTRYSSALNMLVVTINDNARALAASFLILLTVMLLAASGMYYFEREAQPHAFGSIPAAMWWAFSTLTTVGYGDVTPITNGGKVFGAMITVVGIGMVALPTSILASGYGQQLKLSASRYRNEADKALDDGYLSETEKRDLESLRLDLGLGKHAASQILDAEAVDAALRLEQVSPAQRACPHCGKPV